MTAPLLGMYKVIDSDTPGDGKYHMRYWRDVRSPDSFVDRYVSSEVFMGRSRFLFCRDHLLVLTRIEYTAQAARVYKCPYNTTDFELVYEGPVGSRAEDLGRVTNAGILVFSRIDLGGSDRSYHYAFVTTDGTVYQLPNSSRGAWGYTWGVSRHIAGVVYVGDDRLQFALYDSSLPSSSQYRILPPVPVDTLATVPLNFGAAGYDGFDYIDSVVDEFIAAYTSEPSATYFPTYAENALVRQNGEARLFHTVINWSDYSSDIRSNGVRAVVGDWGYPGKRYGSTETDEDDQIVEVVGAPAINFTPGGVDIAPYVPPAFWVEAKYALEAAE